MPTEQRAIQSTGGSDLADVLERVLDTGIVIAGDIKVFLAGIELLTVQIRLIVCSVDKAEQIGLDWWRGNPAFSRVPAKPALEAPARTVEERLAALEQTIRGEPPEKG